MTTKARWIAAWALAGALASGTAQAHGGHYLQWALSIGTPALQWHIGSRGPRAVVAVPVVVPSRHWRHARHRGHGYHRGYVDRDRDGIPDRYDRVYNPRWDRDGDGIPNRHDPHPFRADR